MISGQSPHNILKHSGRSGNGGHRPPISTKEPTFLNRATVGHARLANHAPRAPRAPQVSRKCPAMPRKFPQIPAKSRRCPANSRNVPQPQNEEYDTSIDHGIRARRRLAPQWRSSLTIAHRSLEEYITADPQRKFEVRR
jgi:hypothetical protein